MKIFFVLPVFNDQLSLSKLIEDLRKILNKNEDILQFIIVDDASTKKFNNFVDMQGVHYIKLKSNQGNQKAIFVGMNYLQDLNADFDYLIVMDSDGEDRPQDVPKLIEQSKNLNNDSIIFASRLKRNEGLVYKFFYFFYKLIFKLLTGQKLNFGNFSCIPKKFLKNILDLQTISIHYSASVLKSKILHSTISFDKGKRYDGITQTNLTNIIIHALKSLSIYYEEILVKFLVFSAIGSVLGILSMIFIFFNKFFSSFVLIGWSSNMILGLSIITIMFMSMFFACLLILLNKSPYNNNLDNNKNYKSLIDKIENLS
tara:strand:- start:500 stop:1441 length:942 start_codon:yes stop_codon:yes gene_type:complete